MLLSHRRVEVEELGAMLATHAAVHTRYRVHVVERAQVVSEDALLLRGFGRLGAVGRPVVTALLGGRALLRTPEARLCLEPGQASLLPSKSALAMRQEGPGYLSVVVEYDPGALGQRPPEAAVLALPEGPRQRLLQAAAALRGNEDDTEAAAREVAAIWRALREAGAPLGEVQPADLIEEVSAAERELGRALDALQSRLIDRPMMVDLHEALSLSERQVNRRVSAFNERYGFSTAGWRDTRNRWRLIMGATLMTAPGARVSVVARAVGFSSGETFARALARAGLPPPSDIAALVDELASHDLRGG